MPNLCVAIAKNASGGGCFGEPPSANKFLEKYYAILFLLSLTKSKGGSVEDSSLYLKRRCVSLKGWVYSSPGVRVLRVIYFSFYGIASSEGPEVLLAW